MTERVQNGPVDHGQPQPQRLLDFLVTQIGDVWIQQHIQVTDIHRVIGDTGNVVIHDHQIVQCLCKIFCRAKLQELAAFLQKLLKIDADVPGAVRCVAFAQIADTLLRELATHQFIQTFPFVQHCQEVFRISCQIGHFLLMGVGGFCQRLIDLIPFCFYHFRC